MAGAFRLPGFTHWAFIYVVAVTTWASHLTSLGLRLTACKVGTLPAPSSPAATGLHTHIHTGENTARIPAHGKCLVTTIATIGTAPLLPPD